MSSRVQVTRAQAVNFAQADLEQVLQQLTLDEKLSLLTVRICILAAHVPVLLLIDVACFG
jgi:hypothetical protein